MVKIIILCVIALLALSFFGITLQSIVESPAGQANFAYVWGFILLGWAWIVSFLESGAHGLTHMVS